MLNADKLKSFLVEDDASRFFDQCSDEELKPQYQGNGLPKTNRSFTIEEIKVVFDGLTPKK